MLYSLLLGIRFIGMIKHNEPALSPDALGTRGKDGQGRRAQGLGRWHKVLMYYHKRTYKRIGGRSCGDYTNGRGMPTRWLPLDRCPSIEGYGGYGGVGGRKVHNRQCTCPSGFIF